MSFPWNNPSSEPQVSLPKYDMYVIKQRRLVGLPSQIRGMMRSDITHLATFVQSNRLVVPKTNGESRMRPYSPSEQETLVNHRLAEQASRAGCTHVGSLTYHPVDESAGYTRPGWLVTAEGYKAINS